MSSELAPTDSAITAKKDCFYQEYPYVLHVIARLCGHTYDTLVPRPLEVSHHNVSAAMISSPKDNWRARSMPRIRKMLTCGLL